MSETFVRFPPPSGPVLVPTASRASARAGLALHPSCRPGVRAARRVLACACTLFGTWALPGPRVGWSAPDAQAWAGLVERWTAALGRFDGMAVIERRQPRRGGFSVLLLRHGEPLAFVRVSGDADRLLREQKALAHIGRFRPRTFWAPTPVAAGSSLGSHWLATTAMRTVLHVPASPSDVAAITEEIAAALEPALPRTPEVPRHWVPAHGDLAPWNLRDVGSRRPVLLDWEGVRWTPPGTDALGFALTTAAVLGGPPPTRASLESVEWWHARLAARRDVDEDAWLERAMRALLDRVEATQ